MLVTSTRRGEFVGRASALLWLILGLVSAACQAPASTGSSSGSQAGQAPKAHVVKAFNYAFASKMADPIIDGTRLDAFIAGDDEASKQKALEFAESIGFRSVDAGPLAMARALEGMGLLNVLLQIKHNWPWQSGWKLAGPTGDKK